MVYIYTVSQKKALVISHTFIFALQCEVFVFLFIVVTLFYDYFLFSRF